MPAASKPLFRVVIYPPRDDLTGKPLLDKNEFFVHGTRAKIAGDGETATFQVMDGREVVFAILLHTLMFFKKEIVANKTEVPFTTPTKKVKLGLAS